MILIAIVAILIYRGYKPPVTLTLWAITGVLVLILLRIHMTSPLPLEF